jgi:hypothetical protein
VSLALLAGLPDGDSVGVFSLALLEGFLDEGVVLSLFGVVGVVSLALLATPNYTSSRLVCYFLL